MQRTPITKDGRHLACGGQVEWVRGPGGRFALMDKGAGVLPSTTRHECGTADHVEWTGHSDGAAPSVAEGNGTEPTDGGRPTMAELAAHKRTALRALYDATFPSERAWSQHATNAAIRTALTTGTPAPRPEGAAIGTGDAIVDALAAALAGRVGATLDEQRVREIAQDEATRAFAQAATPAPLVVTTGDGVDLGRVEGQYHYLVPKVASALAAGCHVFLVGAAGGGKTTLARHAAAAVGYTGTRFISPSIGPDTRAGRLVGYRSPTTGDYLRGLLHDHATVGGCVMFDEADTSHPSVMPELNALLANGHYVFGDGQEYGIHPDFRVIVGANTVGHGANATYPARQPIDGATLDRFVFVTVDYDPNIERIMLGLAPKATPARTYTARTLTVAERESWYARVHALRTSAQATGSRLLITPRAMLYGLRLLGAGWTTTEAEEAVIWKGETTSADERSRIAAGVRS